MDAKQHLDMENERTAVSQGMSTASAMAARQDEQVYKNHKFLGELRDSGLSDDLVHDLGPILSGAHVTAYHNPETHEPRITWLNENEAERGIIRASPGRLLKENPTMLSVAQGVHRRPDKAAIQPMTQDERAEHRQALKAATSLQTLGLDGKGLETVGTVQTSTEVRKSSDGESSWKERAAKIYG